MALVTLSNLEKHFGQRIIFEGLDFTIDRGERVGLIGDNGTGKTTLFRAITGQMQMDSGTVAVVDGARLGYLEQDPRFDPTNTVMDEAELAFKELHDLSHRLRELEHEMAEVVGGALDKVLAKYQDTQHDFESAGGYAWRHKLEAMLEGVGLPPSTWEQKVSTLSGGQRSRLALAKLLVGNCDLLLLDEPTNHLDLAAIDWLENYLSTFSGAVLIVSHDRYLLDRIATRIAWLTGAQIKSYPGNYSAFVEQRRIQELSQQRAYEQQRADIEKQSEFIRRFGAGQRSKEAKGREKRLNRLLEGDDLIQRVETSANIRVNLNADLRAGDRVLRVKELSKAYDGRALWKDVAIDISRGERIGIIGPNGSGKTTLLEVLLDKTKPDAGEIKWGASLQLGYYDQRLGNFNPDHTVGEAIREGRDVSDADVRAVSALMLFRNQDIDKPIRMLSGGERARVAIAQILIDRPNVLIMDEPTNHLDIASREALERALVDFDGTVICVSHDRYFLDKVSERLLVLEPPNIYSFDGNYTKWAKRSATKKTEPHSAPSKQATKSKPRPPEPDKKKKADNPYLRKFGRLTMEELEKQIAQGEAGLRKFQEQLADPQLARDHSKLRNVQTETDALAKKLKELEAEYFARGQ